MLKFRVGFHYRDFNGEVAESGYTVVDVSNVQALDTFVLASETVMQALSDAPIVSALAYARMPAYVLKGTTGPASVQTQLLCLFTNDLLVGSFAVPAPRADLDYELVEPYTGVRIARGPNATALLIEELGALLANTVLADGRPFPTGKWVAGLMGRAYA